MSPRYQNGTIETAKTAAGETIYLRFTSADGKRPRVRVGLKSGFKKKSDLDAELRRIRDRFNAGELEPVQVHTVGQLIDRYEAEEMPARFSTSAGYKKLHRIIRARWADVDVNQIAPLEVRAWLRELALKDGTAASSRYKGHILVQFRLLLKSAMLWRWMPPQVNPLSLIKVEGATKRAKAPRVVSPEDFRKLLDHFDKNEDRKDGELMRTLVSAAYLLGLRVSEIIGLKWKDIDYLSRTVHVSRAVVRGREDKVKTERSEAPLPLAEPVAQAFLRWHSEAPFKGYEDWVFGSTVRKGRIPVDARHLQADVLAPAGVAIGWGEGLGWHTFRHAYKNLLDRVSEDATLKMHLMRHADIYMTNKYGNTEMDRLRVANDAAVALALPGRVM